MNEGGMSSVLSLDLLAGVDRRQVTVDTLKKLDPRELADNPVMLVVEVGSVATTVLSIINPSTLGWLVTVWLWLTVLFANFAEAIAEGRGKAQANALRATRTTTVAQRREGAFQARYFEVRRTVTVPQIIVVHFASSNSRNIFIPRHRLTRTESCVRPVCAAISGPVMPSTRRRINVSR